MFLPQMRRSTGVDLDLDVARLIPVGVPRVRAAQPGGL
jgi:hypothetical protein